MKYLPVRLLLIVGAGFFLFEAALHLLGLPILQHDKIFLFTHDRYIGIYALTMCAIMSLTAFDIERYRVFFWVIMTSVLLGIGNAMFIARAGGYRVLFPPAQTVDGQLSLLGVGAIVWYLLLLISYFVLRPTSKTD